MADSGGRVAGAARRPIVGADRLARYLVGGLSKVDGVFSASTIWVNGQPALRMEVDGRLVGISTVTVQDGRVTQVYSIANTDKLGRLDEETTISR